MLDTGILWELKCSGMRQWVIGHVVTSVSKARSNFFTNTTVRTPNLTGISRTGLEKVNHCLPRIWGSLGADMKSTVFWDVRPCCLMECTIISQELAASIRVLYPDDILSFHRNLLDPSGYYTLMEGAGSSEILGNFCQTANSYPRRQNFLPLFLPLTATISITLLPV